jgi:hypothetical protein
MSELRLYFDPLAPAVLEGAVTFETGASNQQVIDPTLWAYEHHGEGFGEADPGALTCLYEDLVLGRPTPPSFVLNRVGDSDALVAAALFLYRELVLHPSTVGFVAQVDLVHRRGFSAMGHLDADMGRFMRLLRGYFPEHLSQQETAERLPLAVGWVRDWLLESRLPALGASFPIPTVLDRGPGGFVVAETLGSLPEGWIELYRLGMLRGVLFGPRKGTLLPVLVSRKSSFVPLDLYQAAFRLNEVEVHLGGLPRWAVDGDWLWGPPEGSLVLAHRIVQILVGL